MGDFLFGPKAQPAQVTQGATPEQAAAAQANTQQGLAQQQAFIQALQGQNGVQNQSNVFNQYAAIASGQAPNPALQAQQTALANATGANVANQAALMAGQRGAGANAGLIARQAAMQGAGIQQQAAGQGAEMQGNLVAQQQANALGAMGNISGQQVGNLGSANQAYNQAALGQQQNLLGAINAQNDAQVKATNGANDANKGRGFMGALSGLSQAATGAGKLMAGGAAHGGEIAPVQPAGNYGRGGYQENYAGGGTVAASGPQSALGRALMLQAGGSVPGKAQVAGDSLKNDTVDAKLSPGEIVIPRSIAQGKDAPKRAAEFVAAIQARKKPSKK